MWDEGGKVFVGEWKDDWRKEGDVYELEEDDTHSLYHVKYDDKGNEKSRELKSKGHKL
jgi:hypothetical protein